MKTHWKKPLILPLLLALAAGPAFSQDTNAGDTGTNIVTATITPDDSPATNGAISAPLAPKPPKPPKPPSESTPVRIDSTGIHVGGSDPVDINIPGLGSKLAKEFAADASSEAHTSPSDESSIGLWIPLAGIVVPFGTIVAVFGLLFYYRHRRSVILHETLRSMIDKGVPIPPELILPPGRLARQRTKSDLRAGLVMVGIGLAVMLFSWKVGLIPGFIGIAFLITWFIEKKNKDAATTI